MQKIVYINPESGEKFTFKIDGVDYDELLKSDTPERARKLCNENLKRSVMGFGKDVEVPVEIINNLKDSELDAFLINIETDINKALINLYTIISASQLMVYQGNEEILFTEVYEICFNSYDSVCVSPGRAGQILILEKHDLEEQYTTLIA